MSDKERELALRWSRRKFAWIYGVCGIGRLSKRSTVATISFMVTAALTVFVVNEVLGGAV